MASVRVVVSARTPDEMDARLAVGRAVVDRCGHIPSTELLAFGTGPLAAEVDGHAGMFADVATLLVDADAEDPARLDAALLRRPLAEVFVVVGRHRLSTPDEIGLMLGLLGLRRDLAAIYGESEGSDVDSILEHGGVFWTGPLCSVGGFLGDGLRSVHDRLISAGSDVVLLPGRSEAVTRHHGAHLSVVPA